MTPHEDEQVSLDDDLTSALEADTEETTETVAETTTEITEETAEAVENAETVEEVLEALQAPSRWSKEAKDAFDSFGGVDNGTAYQQAMLDQYGSTQAYTTQKEQEAAKYGKQAQDWNSIFEPFQNQMNLQGTDGPTFMRQLLGYYQSLNANPSAVIQQLAQNYNLDLATLGQDAPYQSPNEVALMQRVDQLDRAFRGNQEQVRSTELDRLSQQIQSFADETDASGNQLHPHFQTVQESMTKLISGGLAQDLPGAYDMACKLDSTVSAQTEAEKVQQDTARKAAKASKAKEAAQRTTGKHTGKDTKVESIDDELLAQIENAA